MNQAPFATQVKLVPDQLPAGQRLGAIGSSSFWGEDSRGICQSAGSKLTTVFGLVLLTGGMPGVGEAVGRSFFEYRKQLSFDPCIYHILPRGSGSWDYGVTLHGGEFIRDRKDILGRMAPIYLVIEGGPGTVNEAKVALADGATVVPVGRTGGCALDLYLEMGCPDPRLDSEWPLMNDSTASFDRIGIAAKRIVEIQIGLDV